MVFIYTKQHMTWPWIQCAPTHYPNMSYHTRNVCYVFVQVVQLWISQFSNQIIITQTNVLQFVFMYKNIYRVVRFMGDIHLKIKKCMLCPNMPKPTSETTLYISKEILMMEKLITFFHTSFYIPEIKYIISCSTCLPPWDSSLRQHIP